MTTASPSLADLIAERRRIRAAYPPGWELRQVRAAWPHVFGHVDRLLHDARRLFGGRWMYEPDVSHNPRTMWPSQRELRIEVTREGRPIITLAFIFSDTSLRYCTKGDKPSVGPDSTPATSPKFFEAISEAFANACPLDMS